MDTQVAQNGVSDAPVTSPRSNLQVRFGKRDNQVLRLDVAESVLSMLAERKPQLFGALLSEVLTGVPAKLGRS